MISVDGKIRLTEKEQEMFRAQTGLTRIPETVAEYNQALEDARAYWNQEAGAEGSGDSPENRLLNFMLEDDKVR